MTLLFLAIPLGIVLGIFFSKKFGSSALCTAPHGEETCSGGENTCADEHESCSAEEGSCESESVARKTVPELMAGGINNVDDLRAALQCAIELEFSIIPLYLTAEWSIKDQEDPVAGIVHEIAIQEMIHMALACNMLTAIGGKPSLTHRGFVPNYPVKGLPGGIQPNLNVDLQALSMDSLKVFLEIEYPAGGPICASESYPTIGDFYTAIGKALQTLKPEFVSGIQMEHSFAAGEVFAIKSVEDAVRAIEYIKEQGEGTSQTPMPPESYSGEPSHYYAFKQLVEGRRLQKGADGKWRFDGPVVAIPAVHTFGPVADSSSAEFNQTLSELLHALQKVWEIGPKEFKKGMQAMGKMRKLGIGLMQRGVRPEFRYNSAGLTNQERKFAMCQNPKSTTGCSTTSKCGGRCAGGKKPAPAPTKCPQPPKVEPKKLVSGECKCHGECGCKTGATSCGCR